jgi:hypothetical protein
MLLDEAEEAIAVIQEAAPDVAAVVAPVIEALEDRIATLEDALADAGAEVPPEDGADMAADEEEVAA